MPQERTNGDAQRIADRERWSFLVAKDQVAIPPSHRLSPVIILPAAGALAILSISCGSGAPAGRSGDVVVAEPGALATAQARAQATEVTGIIATQTATAKDKTSPTSSPSPEPPTPAPAAEKKPLPPEAEQFLSNLDNFPSITPERRQALQVGFERDWAAANTELKKYGAYITLYDRLWADYNLNKSQAIRAEMKKIQEFLASRPEWSRYYQAALEDKNAFLN